MYIAYVFDENFAACAAVSMVSLLENNKKANGVHFFIFDDGIAEESRKKLCALCDSYKADIVFIDAKPICERMAKFNVQPWRGRYSAYIKLMLSSFLPLEVERLIVLDADTIVVGDIGELCTMDLEGHPCAMALEGIDGRYRFLSGVGNSELYNTGVIVYDLPGWRRKEVEKRFVDHLTTVRSRYMLPEEDAISIVLKGDVKRLAPQFNFITQFQAYATERYFKRFHWDRMGECFYKLEEVQKARKDVRIYHCIDMFTGRPWYAENVHPYTKYYDQFLSMTPWRNIPKHNQKVSYLVRLEYLIKKYSPQPLSDYFYSVAARWVYTTKAKKYYKS